MTDLRCPKPIGFASVNHRWQLRVTPLNSVCDTRHTPCTNRPTMRTLALLLTLSGCITHLAVRTREHLRIAWARDWNDAAARAAREQKPILMILVAGQIDGLC
jgi:hypothetical protein